MNVKDANYAIAGLNHIIELAAALAQDIEAMAWEGIEDHVEATGERPITAVRLAQDTLTPVPEAPAATPDPAPESVSLEQVRAVLSELSQAGLTAEVRELILAAGADRLSEVDPTKYGWLLTQARGLSDA